MLSRLKKIIRRSAIVSAYFEYLLKRDEQRRFLHDAEESIKQRCIPDADKVINAYLKDLRKYMFTFSEWYDMYNLVNSDETEKTKYISRSRAQKYYRKLNNPSTRQIFWDKPKFLNVYSKLIHRKYLAVSPSTTIEELREIIESCDVIIKPQNGSLGVGIYKIRKHKVEESELKTLLAKCIEERSLIEECVEGHPSIQAYNESSLNTIRVITASDKNEIRIFASFIRYGRENAVVDNCHAGGIFCTIDINNGKVISDGHTVTSAIFDKHPDSGLPFKGFTIPFWEEICRVCREAHKLCDLPFVGWDVCVTNKDEIEIIEGNHAPDVDVIQGPLHIGYREQFINICKQFHK